MSGKNNNNNNKDNLPKGEVKSGALALTTVAKSKTELVNVDDEGISYSVRSVAVDYLFIKARFIELMKILFPDGVVATGLCKAWGYSLNNESLRNINGRCVAYKGQECTYEHLLSCLAQQEEMSALTRENAILAGKSVVTVSRIARAYAVENRAFLKKHPNFCRFPVDVRGELSEEFGFPNIMYACALTELTSKYDALHTFYENWQNVINQAYAKGYVINAAKRRDWVEEFESYVKFMRMKQ